MKSQALWQISIPISEAGEDAVSFLFENIFGQPPSIYTHTDSGKTVASVFLERDSQWNSLVKTRFTTDLKALSHFGIEIDLTKLRAKKLPRENWAESWKKHFKPIEIGNALLIKPSWSKRTPRPNQACVVLDPGLSFGTGQHATTLFCLKQLVGQRRKNIAQNFLDIGTGSGILAISAAKLGYAPVQAFDLDPEAVRVSRENMKANGIGKKIVPQQKDLAGLSETSEEKFSLICANLICDVLLRERKKIVNRLARDGSLVLAGILKTQFPEVKGAYETTGLRLAESVVGKEWRSGRFVFPPRRHKQNH
ncbi:MAG: 50S ribosomal protein L11 methyltransferase [Verrucomicrobiota bacterium]